MSRPTCDVNGPEYQAILRGRDMYRRYGMNYKDVMWMEDTLERLEKKLHHGDYTDKDWADFLRVREIHARIFVKTETGNGETAENHTTSHYLWHTQHDGKVRPEHAANDGKVFAWDDPPPTGNPGEAFGCRCWAEPYKKDTEELQEHSSQIVTYAAPDASPSWTRKDFTHHYYFGKGLPVTLDEIGHLQDIIDCAKTYDQAAVGGGTIFNRVADQILETARQKGAGSFSDYFRNGYEFRDFVWSIGGATVNAAFSANVVEKGDFLIVTADIEYTFTDMFTNPLDLPEGKSECKGWDLPGATPYLIVGTWSTHLEAIIRK